MAGMIRSIGVASVAVGLTGLAVDVRGEDLQLRLRYQVEASVAGVGHYHRLERDETWDPLQTALIVCDVWDLHHSVNAVRRMKQFLPRLDHVIAQLRRQGVTIIHAPSDCMESYAQHPARLRAIATKPGVGLPPAEAADWCSQIPTEEWGVYPIDQSDGGEDDDPRERSEWRDQLVAMGRNPGTPWRAQSDQIEIDPDHDFISDRGDEVWSILASRHIRHVILTGVHTNMCVLGRPFGLRQMVRHGKNVVLVRDVTDTMYNPRQWPYISHFTANDRIVDHVERYICPTISSDQITGGEPFRFVDDTRPHLVMLLAETLYDLPRTMTQFAQEQLGRDFRVTPIYASADDPHTLPGIDIVRDADVLLIAARRRALPADALALVRRHVAEGKPVLGLRTASHAFSLRGEPPPKGHSEWPEFDHEVLGGNYHGHHPNDAKSTVQIVSRHPLTEGIGSSEFVQGGSLYRTSPLAPGTTLIATGSVEGASDEPVAWTYTRRDGGRSFYTSMGHPDDFSNADFRRLLTNALQWAAGLQLNTSSVEEDSVPRNMAWERVTVPVSALAVERELAVEGELYYRCALAVPRDWMTDPFSLSCPAADRIWVDGILWTRGQADGEWRAPSDARPVGEVCLLVVRLTKGHRLATPPVVRRPEGDAWELSGTWQYQVAAPGEEFSDMPLPAKFGASADIVLSPQPLFVARPYTPSHWFTSGVEGPACDMNGDVYAVNFGVQGTVGRVVNGRGERVVTLPDGSIGNGIRFDANGDFYVADYTGHNVLHVNASTGEVNRFAHEDHMNQPNDLAIAPDGTLFASDPNWNDGTGQLWRIDRDGAVTRLAEKMGTTNGLDVSPDGSTLYVNESVQRNVWAFTIAADKSLTNKRLVRKFDDHGFDGMRCDIDGNLYITRHGKGTVIKMTPSGVVLQEVDVLGSRPTNLCFGGRDWQTVFVTEVDFGRIVSFRADRPGVRPLFALQRGKP